MNSRKKKRNEPTEPTAGQLRRKLSKLDKEIARLCNDRADVFCDFLQRLKSEAPNTDYIRSLAEKQSSTLGVDGLVAIFREIDSASRALVKTTSVAYLGPEFSYSHLAAIERFGQSSQLTPVSNIAAVFESVARGDANHGIVPIENSTDGRIVDTLEMFSRATVRICGEVPIRIHHNLLGMCSQSQITEVQSKPQALSQCREWLAHQLPKARLVAATSTTAAAQNAMHKKGVAAIASKQAGINYGLNVIASNIEDNPNNVTRFAVLGREIAPKTGDDKTSLMFELNHEPGALADAMAIFKRNRLNLTWIESFPKQGSPNEYIFFVELEGHQSDVRVRRAINSIKKKTVLVEILGSYARAKTL